MVNAHDQRACPPKFISGFGNLREGRRPSPRAAAANLHRTPHVSLRKRVSSHGFFASLND